MEITRFKLDGNPKPSMLRSGIRDAGYLPRIFNHRFFGVMLVRINQIKIKDLKSKVRHKIYFHCPNIESASKMPSNISFCRNTPKVSPLKTCNCRSAAERRAQTTNKKSLNGTFHQTLN